MHILTLDMGTSGLKCTLFRRDGSPVQARVEPYGSAYPRPGWAQQDPNAYLHAATRAARAVMAASGIRPGRVAAVGLSGTMNGMIPVDGEGNPLYDNLIHSDGRGAAYLDRIAGACPGPTYASLTGHRLDCHYSLPKILWFREREPERYRCARFFLNTKDYVYARLTGTAGVTDPSDASLTGAFDLAKRRWATELLRELGVEPALMPEIRPSTDASGRLLPAWAEALGLAAGTPVVLGGGDGACATRGSGIARPGQAYAYVGSSAWVATLSPAPLADDRLFHFCDLDGEHVCPVGTVQCGAAAFDWARALLVPEMGDDFARIDALAASAPPGAAGAFFLPYLMGERTPHWDPDARGGWVGASLFHRREHLLRAVYEGVAYALRNALDLLQAAGAPVENLALIGGGAKSPFWSQLMADIFAKPVRVHRSPGEATSLGSAMAAGVGVGLFDWRGAANLAAHRPPVPPEPAASQAYAPRYRLYNQLYPALRETYAAIAQLE